MIKVYMHKFLADDLGLDESTALKKDFRNYKEGKGLPNTFGRDVPYDFTHNRSVLELQHLHFNKSGFPIKLVQFRRTSGYVLVYCPAFYDRDAYLLISIIKHWDPQKPREVNNTDRDTDLMAALEAIAERFRNQF